MRTQEPSHDTPSLVGRQRHGYVALEFGVGAAKREAGAGRGVKCDYGRLEYKSTPLTSSEELAEEEWLDLVGGREWGEVIDAGCDKKMKGLYHSIPLCRTMYLFE